MSGIQIFLMSLILSFSQLSAVIEDIPKEYNAPITHETIFLDHERVVLEYILNPDKNLSIAKVINQREDIRKSIKNYNPYLKEREIDEIERAVIFYSIKYKVPADLVYAVIASESNFRPTLIGSLDDTGLMQIRQKYAPSWARELKIEYKGEATLYDITTNIKIGVYFLGMLLEKYDGNVEKALVAYNAGPGFVDRALASGRNLPRTYIALVNRHYDRLFGTRDY